MKALRCVAVALTLACTPVAASAAPIAYAVEFDGSVWGSPGTGSFLYDADTGIMTDFVWDFGAGLTGGIEDSLLATASFAPGLSETFGSIVFSVLTESPAVLQYIALANVGSFPSPSAGFCSVGAHASCRVTDGSGAPTYLFPVSGVERPDLWFRGFVSVSRTVSVPEPATIAMLGIGLAGLGLIRRRRAG